MGAVTVSAWEDFEDPFAVLKPPPRARTLITAHPAAAEPPETSQGRPESAELVQDEFPAMNLTPTPPRPVKARAKRQGPYRSKAAKIALMDAYRHLYGPDHRLATELGIPVGDVAYTPSEYKSPRKPHISDLPLAVLTSPHLTAARAFCDTLATTRAHIPDAKPTHPSNAWLEPVDLLLRVDGWTPDELDTILEFMNAHGSLTTWITTPHTLRWNLHLIVTNPKFATWAIKANRLVRPDMIVKTREHANKQPANSGRAGRLAPMPTNVTTGDHAVGGFRTETLT